MTDEVPNKNWWSELTTLDKAMFAGQIATVVTALFTAGVLAATVYFSYQTWQETKRTREDQAAAFYAEKAPRLEIAAVAYNESLKVTLRNTGGSQATHVVSNCSIYHPGDMEDPVYTSTINQDIFQQASVNTYCFEANDKNFGFKPKSVSQTDRTPPEKTWVTVWYEYEDAGHKKNRLSGTVAVEK